MTNRMMTEPDLLVISESSDACADREAYLFGDLEAEASRVFESHKQGCAACRKEVAEYRLFTAVFAPPQSVTERVSEAEHQRMMEGVFRAASMEKIADPSERAGISVVSSAESAETVVAPLEKRVAVGALERTRKSVVLSEKVRTFGLLGRWGDFSAILSVLSPRSLVWGGLIFAMVVGLIASVRFGRSRELVIPSVSRAFHVSEHVKPMTRKRTKRPRPREIAASRKNHTKEPQTPRSWSPRESFSIVVRATDPKRHKDEKARQQDVFEIESLRVIVPFSKSSNGTGRMTSYPRESSQGEDFVFAGEMVRLEPNESTSQNLGIEVRIEDDPHAFFQLRQAEMVAREAEKRAASADAIKENPEIPLIQRAIPRAIGEETILPALIL